MPFLIDGYNLLRMVEKISDEEDTVDDVGLCRAISRFLKLTNDRGEIVFDGTGPPDKTGFNNISDLEIIFTGFHTDADTVIERKIEANTAPKRLVVVSNDRRLRAAAKARKAVSAKSEDFWGNVKKELERRRGIKEPRGKRNGLTQGETQQWMELFGLDEE